MAAVTPSCTSLPVAETMAAIRLAQLILSGSTLYGMTAFGGSGRQGVLFKINADGRGYSILHSFAGGRSDGRGPLGSLTLFSSSLYGMTCTGGNNGNGVVFKLDVK